MVSHLYIHLTFFIFSPIINDLGGNDIDNNPSNKILEYNPETEVWTELGTMKVASGDHGLSIVDYEDYQGLCK